MTAPPPTLGAEPWETDGRSGSVMAGTVKAAVSRFGERLQPYTSSRLNEATMVMWYVGSNH